MMKTVYEIFIGSEASYARPSRLDPPSLPYTDMIIGAAVLIGSVGLVILFRFLHKKWKSQRYSRISSGAAPSRKKDLAQYEKQALAQKIRETRISNLKKSFAGEDNSKYMIFATVGLIVLTVLFVLAMIALRFRKF
jgi:hypothetical protein